MTASRQALRTSARYTGCVARIQPSPSASASVCPENAYQRSLYHWDVPSCAALHSRSGTRLATARNRASLRPSAAVARSSSRVRSSTRASSVRLDSCSSLFATSSSSVSTWSSSKAVRISSSAWACPPRPASGTAVAAAAGTWSKCDCAATRRCGRLRSSISRAFSSSAASSAVRSCSASSRSFAVSPAPPIGSMESDIVAFRRGRRTHSRRSWLSVPTAKPDISL